MASASSLNFSTTEMLRRLRAGQRWLTEHQELFLARDPRAASDIAFGRALAAWIELERCFGCTNYDGCIWAPNGRCPEDSPVICAGCIGNTQAEPVVPTAQMGLAIGGDGHGH